MLDETASVAIWPQRLTLRPSYFDRNFVSDIRSIAAKIVHDNSFRPFQRSSGEGMPIAHLQLAGMPAVMGGRGHRWVRALTTFDAVRAILEPR